MSYFSPASAERLVRREKAASTYDRIDTSSIDSVTVNRSVAEAISPAPITTDSSSTSSTAASRSPSRWSSTSSEAIDASATSTPAAAASSLKKSPYASRASKPPPSPRASGVAVQRRERQQRYPLARRQIVPRQHRLPAVGQRAQLHAPDGRQVVRRAQHQAQRGDDGRGPELAEAAQQRHQLADEARQAG